jgi:hypothetical protein
MTEFNEAFRPASGGALSTEVQDMQSLLDNRRIRLMAERSAETADFAIKNGYEQDAINFYPNEQAKALGIGIRFNTARLEKGLPLYLPHDHSLAGHLLQGGYSQRTLESARNTLVQKSADSGLILHHVAAKAMQHAIDNQIHPLDLFHNGKLYDFVGSSMHPQTWDGTWQGVRRGLAYTQDRHQTDLHMGKQFADLSRGLGTTSTGLRRYRVHQVADLLGHQMFGQTHSAPVFQALGWAGWRGGVN